MQKSDFKVLPTSVTTKGLGIYAQKNFKVGDDLFTYPGNRVSAEVFAELNEFLANLVDDWRINDKVLEILRQKYGISICRRELLIGVPNWCAIYKTFIQCVITNDYGEFIYWHTYDWTIGAISGEWMCDKNPGIFINEPPPYDAFMNQEHGKVQQSLINVRTETREDREIYFVAKLPIRTGDELLTSYGPFYDRDYDVNLELSNVQNYSYDQIDDEDVVRVQTYERAIINYKSQGELLDVALCSKRRKSCTDSTS